ncbi:MAG: hypothetical protein ABL921_19225, partial [Pirellula sp.]
TLSTRTIAVGCILIVALGFLIRILAAIAWHSSIQSETFLRFGDSDTYWYLAKTVSHGEAYQYGSPNSQIFRAPLYPMFLAPAASLLPDGERYSWWSVLLARFCGCTLGAVCIALIVLCGKRTITFVLGPLDQPTPFDQASRHLRTYANEIGLAGGMLAMLYPGAIGMSVFILSEALFCPLLILCLIATQLSLRDRIAQNRIRSRRWMFFAGGLSGLCCLVRPSWSLWPAFFFPYLILEMRSSQAADPRAKQKMEWSVHCFLFCIGICTAMSPWWIRNYVVTGKFVPTTLQVGASLYDGWHPGASGSSDENMEFVNAFAVEQSNEDDAKLNAGKPLESTYEYRLNRRLQNAAIAWALENPSDAGKLGLVKLAKTWSPLPVAREIGGAWVRWMEAVGYSVIVILAAVGLWATRRSPGAWLTAMPCLYFAILHMFFIGSVRYRQPAVLVLCSMAGIGLVALWCWACQSERNRTTSKGLAVSIDGKANGSHNTSTGDEPS